MKTYTLFAGDATVKALKAELSRYGKNVKPAYGSESIMPNPAYAKVQEGMAIRK